MQDFLLKISLCDEGKSYKIEAAKGTSVNDIMFGVSVLIKCMVRDNVIPNQDIALEMLNTYLNDEQYNEVKE